MADFLGDIPPWADPDATVRDWGFHEHHERAWQDQSLGRNTLSERKTSKKVGIPGIPAKHGNNICNNQVSREDDVHKNEKFSSRRESQF